MIDGAECVVERALPPDQWQFIAIEDRAPLFLTNAELAARMARGNFHAKGGGGLRFFAPPPPSPLAIGHDAHAANLRKSAYVEAVIAADPEIRRTRSRLVPVITTCAAERNEPAPGFTTVLAWLSEWEEYGVTYGTAAFSDRHDRKGRSGGRLPEFQEKAVALGIEAWFALRSKVKAYAIVCDEVRKFDEAEGINWDKAALATGLRDEGGRLKPPSRRTFERRCAAVGRMTEDWALKGPAYSKQKNRTYQKLSRPDRPYQHVDVDNHTLDVMLVHPNGVSLGRANLIIFLDRATAMILGYSISVGDPSYASFVQGLKHAMYPKDLSKFPGVKNEWPCFGRIGSLGVDNALEFIGDNIASASRELGIGTVRFQPRQPWLKGSLERFFKTVGVGLVHQLPGTTLGNPFTLKDHEHIAPATLTVAEFEALLVRWICDVYHRDLTKGLGFIRGHGDAPIAVWNEKVRNYKPSILPDPDLFWMLAGDTKMATIQKDGITWDYITYEGPELWPFLSDPRHRRGSDHTRTTHYRVIRDPFDLRQIAVQSPFTVDVVRVAAVEAHREYAEGLTLHQHKVILANAREHRGKRTNMDELMASKAELARIALSLTNHPGRKKIEKAVARYLGEQATGRLRSSIIAPPPGGPPSDFLDFSEPRRPTTFEGGNRLNKAGRFEDTASPDDDLAELRARKNWATANVNRGAPNEL